MSKRRKENYRKYFIYTVATKARMSDYFPSKRLARKLCDELNQGRIENPQYAIGYLAFRRTREFELYKVVPEGARTKIPQLNFE